MALEVSIPETAPKSDFNKVHMCELRALQPMPLVEPEYPVYELQVRYRMYMADEEGNRFYGKKDHLISVKDFIAMAYQRAQEGDADLMGVVPVLETALATLIEELGSQGSVTVV